MIPIFGTILKSAEIIMKSLREKKKWVEDYKNAKTLVEDLEVFYEFFKAEEITPNELDSHFDKTLEVYRTSGIQKYAFR